MTISAPLPARPPAARRALLIGCAVGGLCLAATQLGAQAFNANPKTTAGAVGYTRNVPGVETIRVDSPTAIVTWTPAAGTFLPAGNVATFTNGASNPDFVILNRILSNQPIRFDGTVLSFLQDAGGGATPGGTVIFSSPGGIIVGATAVFDVGSLVLTSLNVLDDGAGNFYDPATRGLNFAPFGGVPGGAVVTEPGSRIIALNQGSFVAMVSPRIQHGGSVRVNGSAAYIAGETVDMRVNQGLFDIIVKVGSDNPVPLTHLGTTGGPSSGAADDIHAIYLVAMPKNQAITAILQGDIGFDPAVAAGVENGVIVLSAGANVVGGVADRYGDLTGTPAPDLAASFQIRGGIVRSDLIGTARTDIVATPSGAPTLDFLQDVSLFGTRNAIISVGNGQSVNVQGNALVSAAAFDSIDPAAVNLVGGTARIFSQDGGNIHIFGTATVDASARGLIDAVGNSGNGTGGGADVSAAFGTISIDGGLTILANGEGGGDPAAPGPVGGAGTGGVALLAASNGGSVVASGGVTMNAEGTGSASDGSGGVAGATGRGGNVLVTAGGGSIVTLGGAFAASAGGRGGDLIGGTGLAGGLGDAGTITVRTQSGSVSFNGSAAFVTDGTGGTGPLGGRGEGGDLLIEATSGTIAFAGTANGAAGGIGGGATATSGPGGVGQGGTIQLVAHSGTAQSRIGSGGALALTATGTGGRGGGWAGPPTTGGVGGAGNGGAVSVLAESGNGVVTFGAVQGSANGQGGIGGGADSNNGGGAGGIGRGGTVVLGTASGPISPTPAGSATFASADLGATGTGGTGGFGRGAGGNAVGGAVTLSATAAPVTITGAVALDANGNGGAGGDSPGAGLGTSGQAAGGMVVLGAFPHGSSAATGTLTLAQVTGSASGLGTGTGNVAGQWRVAAIGGGSVTATNLTLAATAAGTAPGAAPASAIDPQGGLIKVTGTATLSSDGNIVLTATQGGLVNGGRLILTSLQDVNVSHAAPAVGGFTIDVADLNVRAGDDITVNAGAAVRASNIADIRAVDLVTIAGRVLGRQVAIGSADIDIQASGAVGDPATELVVLEVAGGTTPAGTPAQPTTLGGAAQGPGYTLTGAEAGRIRAGTLRILVPALSANPARAPDLVVRDLTLNGGGAAAGIGILDIVSPGIARVEGNLLMAGARAQDGIAIQAGERVEIVTPAGSVRVRDGNGGPGGTLRLASNNIWVASAAIIGALRADPNYAGRDGDLLDNDGVEVPRGYVEANGVTLVSGGTLYVQNNGSGLPFSTEFAGITVGATGLVITAAAPGTNVTAFGRRLNADGSFTTGDAFFAQSTYNTAGAAGGPGSFTNVAELNTCIIVTGFCGARAPANPLPGGPDPITGPTGGSSAILLPGGAEEDDLVDSSFASDPLIEEPVTSGSEAGLWDCDPDHDGDCDDQD